MKTLITAMVILVCFGLVGCGRYGIRQYAWEYRELENGELKVECVVRTSVEDKTVGRFGEDFFYIYRYLTCEEVPAERERKMKLAIAARDEYDKKYGDLKECPYVD